MSAEVLSLLVLVLVFVIATWRGVSMGALALVAAFAVGLWVFDVKNSEILGGFPASLVVTLIGVTYLFALAKNNGTVDWIVHAAVRAVRGRVALVPWAMFVVTAIVTGIGAVSPAAVAIIAPIALGFAAKYKIHPVLMGMLVVQGATAGSFSPIGIFGSITNGVVAKSGLDGNPVFLFVSAVLACLLIAIITFVTFGGRTLMSRGADAAALADLDDTAGAGAAAMHGDGRVREPHSMVEARQSVAERARPGQTDDLGDTHRLNPERIATLVGLAVLIVGALVLDLDVGFVSLAIAILLSLAFPRTAKGATDQIAWNTILLIAGIVTYVGLLQEQGVVDWLGDGVAGVGAPLLAALLICVIGAVVSAFASTTGIIGALIPLAVPFLQRGEVGAVGLIAALAIASSVVDCSPFSTNGALVVANSEPDQRDSVFRTLMIWGMSIMVIAPVVVWAILVVPTA